MAPPYAIASRSFSVYLDQRDRLLIQHQEHELVVPFGRDRIHTFLPARHLALVDSHGRGYLALGKSNTLALIAHLKTLHSSASSGVIIFNVGIQWLVDAILDFSARYL